jgi:CheY-like chemotaxis protein
MAAPLPRPVGAVGGLRLLVVEDDVMISTLLEDMLTELGHRVVGPAASVEEASRLVAQAEFDAALLDVNLNGDTVETICEALARRGKPFAFTTGYGEPAIPAAFKDRPVLPKPYKIDQLGDILARVGAGGSTK